MSRFGTRCQTQKIPALASGENGAPAGDPALVQYCEYRYGDGPKPQSPVVTQSTSTKGTPPPAQAQSPSQVARCAANLANTMSVAHYADLQNVPVASNIFSNDFSSVTSLILGPGRPGAAIGLVENAGAGRALQLTASSAAAVPVSSGLQFLFSSVPAITFGETAAGGLLMKGLGVAADLLSGEAELQVIYDAGIYSGAVYVCAMQ